MRNKTISISSDSDGDEIPLKKMKSNGYVEDTNSYDSLCRHSIEACEFCDRISKNRYSSLVHNVSHIIIPLLNQTVFQCTTCLHHFTSKEDLNTHKRKKHPNLNSEAQCLVKNELSIKTSQSQPSNDSKEVINTENENEKSIKSRLVFEDDDLIILDCNRLLNDLTTDCKVNLEMFDTPWLKDEYSSKSVHYDELVKPGVYRCKKCGKRFPIRYDAIIHESQHITFKDSQINLCDVCNKYIVGNKNVLRHHYLTYHKNHDHINQTHRNNETHVEKKMYVEENGDDKFIDTKVMNLCELCFSFCKNKSTTNYEYVKTISKLGKRFYCQKCGLPFFEIILVKRFIQRSLSRSYTYRKKAKTNEDRLKTIANRFKMMKH